MNNIFFRPIQCRIYAGGNEVFPLHSFSTDLCLDDRLHVQVLESSERDFSFEYRTFRFNQILTMEQEHDIHCEFELDIVPRAADPVPSCTCYDQDSCNNGVWSEWTECDATCYRRRTRNEGVSDDQGSK